MELFAKSKNRLYVRLVDLSHVLKRRGTMPLSEIHSFLMRDNLVAEALINKWLDPSSSEFLPLLVQEAHGEWKFAVEGALPVLPSTTELIWLKQLVGHRLAPVFLDEAVLEKLKHTLAEEPDYRTHLDVRGAGREEHDVSHVRTILGVLLEAVQKGLMVRYSSQSQVGQRFASQGAHVLRLEYSIASDRFYAILYPKEIRRPIKVRVDLMSEVSLAAYDDAEDWDLLLKELQAPEPLVLEVGDAKGALERAFLLLSCFERQASYDRQRDLHVIRVFYYRFDEALLLSRVFSLGESVIIRSPQAFRERFVARLKEMYENHVS
jgi:hypothetical protein